MGGGNAQKTAMARAKAQEKAAKSKKGASQLKNNVAALAYTCQICRSPFMSTVTEATLKTHFENKHPKNTFDDCFPTFGK